jgi:thiol-disulfide isomerase/thioredoxin
MKRIGRPLLYLLLAALGCAASACRDEPPPKPDPAGSSDDRAGRAAATTTTKNKVEWVDAPADEDVAAAVKRELDRAKSDGRTLLVYVGATWCEPCERFHHAAQEGKLDDELPGLRFFAFDLDRDRERLARAGYTSKMIPLFTIPREDGTSSGRQIQGGIKGDGAAAELSARLLRLLGGST